MIVFIATEDQIRQIAVNACKAQLPLICKYLKPEDIELDDQGLFIAGTINIRKRKDNLWEIDEIDRRRCGWIDAYPTARHLIHSVY